MICKVCGTKNDDNAKVCSRCGMLLVPSESSAPTNLNTLPVNNSNFSSNNTTNSQQNSFNYNQSLNDQTINQPSPPNNYGQQPTDVPSNYNQGLNIPSSDKKNNNKFWKILVIIGVILSLILTVLMIARTFIGNNDSNSDYNYNPSYDESSGVAGVKVMSGINVYTSADFQETANSSYAAYYENSNGTAFIATNSVDAYGLTLDEYLPSFIQILADSGFTCASTTYKTIGSDTWAYLQCNDGTQNEFVYLTIKNDTIYVVEIGIVDDMNEDYNQLLANIDANLSFAS